MKVLVTGGAGFIGSHVVEKLVKQGYQVRVLDDLSTGSLDNLSNVVGDIEFIKGDVRDYEAVSRAVEGVDLIVHEAAITSVVRSIEDPLTTSLVNVQGTLNLLWASVRNSIKRFVYASSSSIYGDTPALPKHEELTPNPLSPYAVSKLAGEEYCQVFHKVYGLSTVALRYFNVYGPRQRYGPYSGVVSIFINRILNKQPPVIYGDGEQTRDFTFVEDVAEATIKALETEGIDGEVFNVGCGSPISINQLAKTLMEVAGVSFEPIYTEPRKGDIRHSHADIKKAKELLKWRPSTTLREGLARTYIWFKESSSLT